MARDRSGDDKVYKTFNIEFIMETEKAYRFVNRDDGLLFWVPKSVCEYGGTDDVLIEVWFCDKHDLATR